MFGKPAFWALISITVIWGYNWVVMKDCLRHVSVIDFAALRTVIGSATLFAILIYRRSPLRPKAIPLTFLIGLLSTTGGIGFVVWALSLGAVGKTAILIYVMPFWVLLLAWPILGEKIRGSQWIAVLLAFAGLMVILEPWTLKSTFAGSLLAILSGLTWALSVIVIKMAHRKVAFDLVSLTAWQMFFGTLPLAFLAAFIPTAPISWSPGFAVGLFYSSVISQGIAPLLWYYALQELPAGAASMGTLATPIIGLLAAFVQLGERPSTLESLGIILILTALIFLSIQGLLQTRQALRLLKGR